MIELTRLNGTKFFLNAELIEIIESTPDTVITLTTDKKLVVLENKDEIIDKVIEYKRRIFLE
ncbi:flagellar FlbD family protein [Tepidanaerobacter syntrophicus]|uniref:flagellar FlbD family protein n=1 Tax=Tepidanaerobacter syntrophicus TaxID=224999 RepID=UPI00175B7899|nr:flagellar FlbD family protein [Tepidanaerobacter syntrophicus]GLI19238.1 flagellar FlbD family protein [Tepidanaerobacter syntrophicus]GLI50128.1 flagellar FlbD family protein [Tepidanaerobacter syntrophicus]HHV83536.1 flagellar FlbD family protein [Tepidanaerobacter syntrophicus]